MNSSKIIFSLLIIIVVINLISTSCITQKKIEQSYINNDSTAIYSTNPNKAYKYGVVYTKEECINYYSDFIKISNIKPNEVVAEVGAASGYNIGAMSVLLDSINFYIQDIDTHFLNKIEFEKVVNYYNNIRQKPQTNKFNYVIGTDTETNLPDDYFDVIILNNTFHELTYKNEILDDIYKKLKKNGRLIIEENISSLNRKIYNEVCSIKAPTYDQLTGSMYASNFYLEKSSQPLSSFHNIFIYKKNINESLLSKNYNLIYFISDKIDLLNIKKNSNKSFTTESIGLELYNNKVKIDSIYNNIGECIQMIGSEWLRRKNFKSAMNVFKINLLLDPNSADTYYNIGCAYYKAGYPYVALYYFNKCIDIDSNNKDAIIQIEQIKKIEMDYEIW